MKIVYEQLKCFVLTVNEEPIFIFFDEDAAEHHLEEYVTDDEEKVYAIREVAGQTLAQLVEALTLGKIQFFPSLGKKE